MISAYSLEVEVLPSALYRPTNDMRGRLDKAAICVFMCVRAAASVGAAAKAASDTKLASGSVFQFAGVAAPVFSFDLSMRMPLSGLPSLSMLCKKRAM